MTFVKGHKDFVSSEARKKAAVKISIAMKGKKPSALAIANSILARLGKPLSAETRLKLSSIHKGHVGYWKGKKQYDSTRIKMSEIAKSRGFGKWNLGIPRPMFRGKNSPNWKGGISGWQDIIRHSLEYKNWRMSVFRRDRFQCVTCGAKDQIQADHIKKFIDFPELRLDISNGRTLCYPCHKATPTWGNKKVPV